MFVIQSRICNTWDCKFCMQTMNQLEAIDTFYLTMLATKTSIQVMRWIHEEVSFLWPGPGTHWWKRIILCTVDQSLMTSECKEQSTVVLSCNNWAWVVTTIHGASRRMKRTHTRFPLIQDLMFWKMLTMCTVRTNVNPTSVGTKILVWEEFWRIQAVFWSGNEVAGICSPGIRYNDSDNTPSRKLTTCWTYMSSCRQSSEVCKKVFFSWSGEALRADSSLRETRRRDRL